MSARTPRVRVEPRILVWARESAGLDTGAVAKRLNVRAETVEKWERGSESLTLGTLEKLARFYRRPLAAFLLPEPPEEPPPPRDFRVVPGQSASPLSQESRLAIRRARRVQSLARELSEELGRAAPPTLPRLGSESDAQEAGERERVRLGVSLEEQFRWRTKNQALAAWRRSLEQQGVLTLQFAMPIEEARGLCLPDARLPAVVINSRDAIAGRIFSLFHEYAHLLLGSSALCLAEPEAAPGRSCRRAELFCNSFAGALLVPREALRATEEFQRLVAEATLRATLLEKAVDCLSARFKVSKQVVLFRLLALGTIPNQVFTHKMDALRSQEAPAGRGSSGWAPSARRCLSRHGVLFTSLVFNAYRRQLITRSTVCEYLGVRVKHLDAVEEMVGR